MNWNRFFLIKSILRYVWRCEIQLYLQTLFWPHLPLCSPLCMILSALAPTKQNLKGWGRLFCIMTWLSHNSAPPELFNNNDYDDEKNWLECCQEHWKMACKRLWWWISNNNTSSIGLFCGWPHHKIARIFALPRKKKAYCTVEFVQSSHYHPETFRVEFNARKSGKTLFG